MPRGVPNKKPEDILNDDNIETKEAEIKVDDIPTELSEPIEDITEQSVAETTAPGEPEEIVDDLNEELIEDSDGGEEVIDLIDTDAAVTETESSDNCTSCDVTADEPQEFVFAKGDLLKFKLNFARVYETSTSQKYAKVTGNLYIYKTQIAFDRIAVSAEPDGMYFGWVLINDISSVIKSESAPDTKEG